MAKRKKVQKDKQRSTKHTHKSKDRVTRTPLKINLYLKNKYLFDYRLYKWSEALCKVCNGSYHEQKLKEHFFRSSYLKDFGHNDNKSHSQQYGMLNLLV
jgi:hypothetical protein